MRGNPNPYHVRAVLLADGGRMPALCDRANGRPLFNAASYGMMALRPRGCSTATIDQAMRALMVLRLVLDRLGVGLEARLREGRVLSADETRTVAHCCRLSVADLVAGRWHDPLEPEVNAATRGVRLLYIRDYLDWVVRDRRERVEADGEPAAGLAAELAVVDQVLLAHRPPAGRRRPPAAPGLGNDGKARLAEAIDPASPNNPWAPGHARERNALMLRWLGMTGIRRGELLGLCIRDIDFGAARASLPGGQCVPLPPALAAQTRAYVEGARAATRGAREHDRLFVACGSGAPLTPSALAAVFAALRERCPGLPRNLSPQALRNAWRDAG